MTSNTLLKTNIKPTQAVAAPTKILQNIVQKQLSGTLTIRDPNDDSIFWRVYFGSGNVHFATSAIGQRERLEYLLRQWNYSELAEFRTSQFKSDYQLICEHWKSGKLSLQEARKLLFSMTQEAFVQLLALPKAVVQFEKTVGLDPILLSVPLKQVILPMRGLISQWQQLQPEITSPFQRPLVKNIKHLPSLLWENVRDIKCIQENIRDMKFIQALGKVLSQNLSIYEAALQLKTDVLVLAELLQPLVRAGAVDINPYRSSQTNQGPIIACIDDSKTVQRNVKLILEASGYRVLGISEPAKALTAIARYKPSLVLMDINMPDINGYELSRLLRQSTKLQDIPIVMLTGRDGMIDKLRAHMVGAKDYVTKPFKPQQLLTTVEKNLSEIQQTQSAETSVDVKNLNLAYT